MPVSFRTSVLVSLIVSGCTGQVPSTEPTGPLHAPDAQPFQRAGERFTADIGHQTADITAHGAYLADERGEVLLAVSGHGREGRLLAVRTATPREGACAPGAPGCVRRVERDLDPGVTEWFIARGEGLEQGFTLTDRPAGEGDVVISMTVDGTVRVVGPEEASIVAADGSRWQYDELEAWDAAGERLPAWMTGDDDHLELHVDDDDAVYPIVIDPTLSGPDILTETASWSFPHAADGALSMSGGDFDGDGFDDVATGHPNSLAATYCGAPYQFCGFVGIWPGSAAGVQTSSPTVIAGTYYASFGHMVTVGDFNGDGIDDLAFRAYGASFKREFHIHYGVSGTGIATTADLVINQSPGQLYGAAAADVDGDGKDDLVLSHQPQTGDYEVQVHLGGAAGLSVTPSYTVAAPTGHHVSGTRRLMPVDLDGDALLDLAVPYAGGVDVFFSDTATFAQGTQESVAVNPYGITSGDWNGDGKADLAIGNNLDQTLIYAGTAPGSFAGQTPLTFGQPAGTGQSGTFGEFMYGGIDVSGDGIDDLVVGSGHADPAGQSTDQSLFVFLGSLGGLNAATYSHFIPDTYRQGWGFHVGHAGDVDGDGHHELVVGDSGGPGLTLVEVAALTSTGGDTDGDGVDDGSDNCPGVSNASQTDTNSDGFGDACAHPTAQIDASVTHLGTWIGAGAIVGANAQIGDGSVIGRGADISSGAIIGEGVIVSRTAKVGLGAKLGDGVVLGYGVQVDGSADLGTDVFVGNLAHLTASTIIGNNSVVGREAQITGGAVLGTHVRVGPGSQVAGGLAPAETLEDHSKLRRTATVLASAKVEFGSIVGRDTSVCPGVTVGNNSYIGSNNTVTLDLDPSTRLGSASMLGPCP